MPVENRLFCTRHQHITERFQLYPGSVARFQELMGGDIAIFCDANDALGFAIVRVQKGYYVGAWLYQSPDDKIGEEQDISTPIYFNGQQRLVIFSSGDSMEVHLSHQSIGDSRRVQVNFRQLQPDQYH